MLRKGPSLIIRTLMPRMKYLQTVAFGDFSQGLRWYTYFVSLAILGIFECSRHEACCIVCRCAVFVAVFCNDIPLESKEVPIRKKQERREERRERLAGKRMASCHTWTCKKMKNAIFFFGPTSYLMLLQNVYH